MHLVVGALDQPVRELQDRRRLEVGVGGVGVRVHLRRDGLDDVPPAVSDGRYPGAAAGVEDLGAFGGIPVVPLCFSQERESAEGRLGRAQLRGRVGDVPLGLLRQKPASGLGGGDEPSHLGAGLRFGALAMQREGQ